MGFENMDSQVVLTMSLASDVTRLNNVKLRRITNHVGQSLSPCYPNSLEIVIASSSAPIAHFVYLSENCTSYNPTTHPWKS